MVFRIWSGGLLHMENCRVSDLLLVDSSRHQIGSYMVGHNILEPYGDAITFYWYCIVYVMTGHLDREPESFMDVI